jgi:glutathione synthase/RimK-type ligase-like ATP-grasp enzyme
MKFNRNAYPAAVVCFLMGGLIAWAAQHDWRDTINVGGRVEGANCQEHTDEPLRIICESEDHVCTFYLETGQHQCVDR